MSDFDWKALLKQRNELIATEYKAGGVIAQIAEKYDISVSAVPIIARQYANGRRTQNASKAPTGARNKALCELYVSGRSLETVGKEFGITRERVRQILVHEGIVERHSGFNEPEKIASRERSIQRKEVSALKKAAIQKRRAAIREMYNAGASYAGMSEHFGIPISSVQQAVWLTGGPSRNFNAGKAKRRLTEDERIEVATRYAHGEDRGVLAAEFELSPLTIPMIALALGMKRGHRAVSNGAA